MKKALLFPLFALSLLSLASCEEAIPNQADVDALKALLAKQDLSPCYHKIFSTTFTQDYDVFSSRQGEHARTTQFHSYHGGGAFGCVYAVDKATYASVMAKENYDFFDFLARGRGGYGLLQSATVSSFLDDVDGDDRQSESQVQQNFLQHIQVNFGDNDVQVYSSLTYSEGNDGSNTRFQSFNGELGKDTLFDSISIRALSDLFARTNLYDGQRSCETIDSIYEKTLHSLGGKSNKEISDFILENHIHVGEDETSTLVSFEIGDGSIRAALTKEEIIPGTMTGTLYYDKSTGIFSGFDYRISYRQNTTDSLSGRVYAANMEFTATGYSLNEEFEGDIYIAPNPVVYESGGAFLADMIEGIIPEIA